MLTLVHPLRGIGPHSCVVVIDRDPVELRPEVGFHLLHQVARGGAQTG